MNLPEQESVPLSKTRRKRMMEDLQALGEQLVELSAERLQRMQLPEDLRIAVDAARGMLRRLDGPYQLRTRPVSMCTKFSRG